MLFTIKVIVTALAIVIISELARTHKLLAAMMVSLPFTSILTFIWIYLNQKNIDGLPQMSMDVFWLVLISLPFFILFSVLLKQQINFWIALSVSCASLSLLYFGVMLLKSYW